MRGLVMKILTFLIILFSFKVFSQENCREYYQVYGPKWMVKVIDSSYDYQRKNKVDRRLKRLRQKFDVLAVSYEEIVSTIIKGNEDFGLCEATKGVVILPISSKKDLITFIIVEVGNKDAIWF